MTQRITEEEEAKKAKRTRTTKLLSFLSFLPFLLPLDRIIERKCDPTSDVRSSGRIFEKLICQTASRHIPFQQVLGAQHRPLENEHRPPSGMQVCRPTLATEVNGVKKTPITINRAPAIFNNEVFFICFLLCSGTN